MTAARVLDVARREIGYREGARNANKYGRAYGVDGVAWCMQFCWWVFREAGAGQLIHPKTAYTPTAYDWHRSRGQANSTPRVGSLVFFNWPGDGVDRIQHVGIVEAVEPASIVTIEGNTQSGSAGNQSDGGGVWRRRRARNSSIVGYGHPVYSTPSAKKEAVLTPEQFATLRGDIGFARDQILTHLGIDPRTAPPTLAQPARAGIAPARRVDVGFARDQILALVGEIRVKLDDLIEHQPVAVEIDTSTARGQIDDLVRRVLALEARMSTSEPGGTP